MSARAPIRPLFIAPFGELGGAEMFLLRLTRALDERFEPRALVLTPGFLPNGLRDEGVPTAVMKLPGKQALLRFPAVARHQATSLRGAGISFVHANQAKAAMLGALLAPQLGVPLLWMKHDHILDGRPSRALASRCDRVVCVSQAMAAQFRSQLGDRVSVVYPGVVVPSEVQPLGEEPHVVAVGRLDPAKGWVELLEAVALLRRRGIDARVTVAGPPDRIFPEHGDELRELVARLGIEERSHIGLVDDLADLYDQATVVALASRERPSGAPSEGAPTVLMEAMAHGRPVVAPREAGITEVVGDVGTLVAPRTAPAFADALEPYLRDRVLAAETGRRGHERANRLFAFEHTVGQLTCLYLELAELSGAASRCRGGRAVA